MNNIKIPILAAVLILVIVAIVSSAFIVNETEQVIITQFGKPIREPIITPGIHFKIPIVQVANFFISGSWNGTEIQIRYLLRTRDLSG